MDERLQKQRAVTEKLILEAASKIEGSTGFTEHKEFIVRNELGLALDALADYGKHCEVNADYWHLLKKAAEVMGLKEQVKEFRRKRQLARASAIQPGIQPDEPASGGSAG
ncbi:hypothetical protein F7Q92_03065 [Ideonella dechloratans]|uniref:Uncharacterized protein n=1 Tax=Ideonella dechloratans TaxID=36863 RepID=A0A643FFM6_IDEDE|nr:hypothetical protein [Ideonella dechloratans]KAB0584507.1 hypothetical protein F7Q92_03065 [Ideonella dechloratans]UFU10214.1 hypothetical protein LRM40_00390 [Ideonella dechloratans]